MTIAMLMRSTLNLARHAANLPRLKLRADRETAAKDEAMKNKVVKPAEPFIPKPWAKKRVFALTTLGGFAVGILVGMLLTRRSLK